MLHPSLGLACGARHDCGCCGLRGGLVCHEPEHAGAHAFVCAYCGRGGACD